MSEIIPVTMLRPEILLSLLFGIVFVGIAVYARAVPQGGQRWWIAAVVLVGLLIIAFQIESGLIRTLLLDGAVFAAVALVWVGDNPQAKQAARVYLVMAVVAMVCVTIALVLTGELFGAEGTRPTYPFDQIVVVLLSDRLCDQTCFYSALLLAAQCCFFEQSHDYCVDRRYAGHCRVQ